ncbi:hypothetical protein CVT25_000762 [Psilocybe cyanescens]|uniref:Uncharacterized protein n=1 Tax=Psilocybe cyanescens TaxID=93625 RepID=A0A409XME1_PSICY|nr:hypothetical protein CVT25_000762 [Psilocybe cyanescens]
MPKFTLLKSKPKTGDESISSPPSSPTSTKLQKFPGKVVKKVKRQLWRIDEMLHHVTHTKHEPEGRHEVVQIGRKRTTSSSTAPTPTKFIRAFLPSSPSSFRSSRTWNSKYVREVDIDQLSCSSSEHLPAFTLHPTDLEPPMAEEHREQHPLSVPSPQEHPDEEAPSNSEPMFTSPPTVYIEPETPDPFLIDEEGDALSGDDEEALRGSSAAVSQATVSPAHNVPLDLPPSPSPEPDHAQRQRPPTSPLPNINKDVPPPPSSDSEEEDEEVPDIYVPTLIVPTMFLPIPNTDPLTTLLNKYIYPPEKRPARDLTGDWQRNDFHTLVVSGTFVDDLRIRAMNSLFAVPLRDCVQMTNSWRALARMARDRLVTSDPSDLTLVLGLWHLRLSCLARLRLFNQTSAECTNLFNVLNGIEPVEAREYVFERILPFELEVMQTRLKYWAGDHMGYLDALNVLLKKCRMKCRQSGNDETLVPMWKERGGRVCLIIASQMVEMKEITAAAKLLEPLCKQGDISSPTLRSSVARIYLQGGNVQMAAKHFALVEDDPAADETLKKMNAAILASAMGEWTEASELLKAILEKDANNFVAVNDLSVALLSQGKLKEGIEVLERALYASPSSVVVAEPFLFNLSTLYELRATSGFEKKKELLVEVAKWSGDGLKTNCLKMPAN